VQELLGDDAAVEHGRRAGTVAFAVGHQREVHFDDFGAGGFQGLRGPAHRSITDARVWMRCPVGPPMPGFAGAGFRVGVDVHARHAEALAGQGRGLGGQFG
jgi:hypothetical protein